MARAPILAAGGIVVRGGPEPLVAVVRLRKGDWVLPKGKLNERESALAAARREVLEETGQDVAVQEFLGTMSYDVAGRPKIVQFWRMQALEGPERKPARDVRAVQWLPLDQAIKKLTHAREQVFLANVGPLALKAGDHVVQDRRAEHVVERADARRCSQEFAHGFKTSADSSSSTSRMRSPAVFDDTPRPRPYSTRYRRERRHEALQGDGSNHSSAGIFAHAVLRRRPIIPRRRKANGSRATSSSTPAR